MKPISPNLHCFQTMVGKMISPIIEHIDKTLELQTVNLLTLTSSLSKYLLAPNLLQLGVKLKLIIIYASNFSEVFTWSLIYVSST